MHSLFNSLVEVTVSIISQIGYLGIFIGMFLESTLIPIPSEVIMIPAGIAAAKGGMNIYIATIAGILGNIGGAVFSYYLALFVGNPILLRIGKYFFVKETTILKIEKFFQNHGPISVFIGRLLPGFRHFISLPAGLAKMDIKLFFIYTAAGSAIWTTILSALGFFIGEQQELIEKYLHEIIIIAAISCVAILAAYIFLKPTRK